MLFSQIGRRTVAYLVLIFTSFVLCGCSLFETIKPQEDKELPVPLEITLGAAERVNPTAEGRPSPIVVKVFELSSDTHFMAADYFKLMEREGAPLGEEMLASDEYSLLPGEVRLVRRRAALKSRFLAVVAGYRDLSSSTWRAISPLPAPYLAGRLWSNTVSPTKRLYVLLGERGVTIYEEQPKQ